MFCKSQPFLCIFIIFPFSSKPIHVPPSNKSLLSLNTTALVVGSTIPFSLLLSLFHGHSCTPRSIVLLPLGQIINHYLPRSPHKSHAIITQHSLLCIYKPCFLFFSSFYLSSESITLPSVSEMLFSGRHAAPRVSVFFLTCDACIVYPVGLSVFVSWIFVHATYVQCTH